MYGLYMFAVDINQTIADLEREIAEKTELLKAYTTIARHQKKSDSPNQVSPNTPGDSKQEAVCYGGIINEVKDACKSFLIPFNYKEVIWAISTQGSKLSGKEIRGAFNRLVQKGFLQIHTEGAGRRPATYVVKK
jgi:hypothetical protein